MATRSPADLVSPSTTHCGGEQEQLLAPVEVGGAVASDGQPAAAPAGARAVEEEEEGLDKVEDAVVPAPAPSPCAPSRAEREAHEATHLPFRNWCEVCVQGRLDNPPHRRLPEEVVGARRLPEVHLDYAFLRRADSDVLAKMVVLKALPSRAMQAWVVPSKGVGDQASAERVIRGIRAMGIRPPCVLKCDGEHSVEALREAVMARLGEGAVPQGPPAGESQSNGAVENSVKLLKGLVRVHVLALERKLGFAPPPTPRPRLGYRGRW